MCSASFGTVEHPTGESTGGNPPSILDPFAGGGTIPLEAQRLGLEVHASDLNPVAVLINKALIEIPPKFVGCPPVNLESRKTLLQREWKGAQGLADDIGYYGKWMRDEAWKRMLAGIVFGWVRARMNSIIPSTVMHACYNTVFVIALIFSKHVKHP